VYAYTFRDLASLEIIRDNVSQIALQNMLRDILSPAETPVPDTTSSPLRESGETLSSSGRAVRIIIRDGANQGSSLSLNIPFTVGRKEGDLIIADPLISRRHAIVREMGGSLVIEDLGSTNGTFVNGVEIKLQQITDTDLIKVGSSVIQITPEK
jgi:hypothetical protein